MRERLIRLFEWVADNAPVRTGRAAVQTALLVLGLLGLTAWIVYMTNGTSQPFLHLTYVPVVIASLALGLVGGVLTALAGPGICCARADARSPAICWYNCNSESM